MIYPDLPESVCAALRGASDGLVRWENDVTNNCIRLRLLSGPITVSRADATRYMMAWRDSGVWALRGVPDA